MDSVPHMLLDIHLFIKKALTEYLYVLSLMLISRYRVGGAQQ